MVGQEIFIMNLVFELLHSEGSHNHIFGDNLRRMAHCYLFEAEQEQGGEEYFPCSPAYIVPTRRLARREGYVNG
jgi:hypothetical protein